MNNALVIIPTYNESENILQIIDAVFALPMGFDLLIVDDNSPDGTAQMVKDRFAQFNTSGDVLHLMERKGKLGLGTAYIEGFKWALARNYEHILQMDADFSHNPADLVHLCKACTDQQADLVIGSRYSSGVNVVNWPMGRVLLSYFASVYVRIISGLPVWDATAGFVCYNRRVLETIPLDRIRFIGYAFQIEMKFTTWKYGFKIIEHPIVFTDRTRGQSKMSAGIFKEAFFGVIEMTIRGWFRKFIR